MLRWEPLIFPLLELSVTNRTENAVTAISVALLKPILLGLVLLFVSPTLQFNRLLIGPIFIPPPLHPRTMFLKCKSDHITL